MKRNIVAYIILLSKVLNLAGIPSNVSAQSKENLLLNALVDYKQFPSQAAVEKIIRLASSMEQLPPIPDEARTHFIRGNTLHKEAKTVEDFLRAKEEFLQAVRLAPWYSDARFNLALECEAVGDYASALINLKLYRLFNLSDAEIRFVKDKIDAITTKQESSTEEEQQKQMIAQLSVQQKEIPKNLIKDLKVGYNGVVYIEESCSHFNQEGCFGLGQGFPCGCNEEEAKQKNWYQVTKDNFYILFPTDTTIVIGRSGENPFLRGIARGRWITSIFWEITSNSGWKPVWVLLVDSNLDRILYSDSYIEDMVRPIDNANYNPYKRYDYTMLIRSKSR
jgi:hypothetical protein